MLMYNGSMGIVSEEKRSGFTIIEVMLFLALSGFLLVGILMGTGSSIANQRYKDAVQDAVDALRNAYSFVSDTQVQLRDSSSGVCGGLTSTQYDSSNIRQAYNSGRGRTQCVVYGAVVSINGDKIQTTTLIGEDYADAVKDKTNHDGLSAKSDLEILKELNANNLAVQCGKNAADCHVSVVDNPSTTSLKWGTSFVDPADINGNVSTFQKTLLIFRSPRSGAIRTFVMNGLIMDGTEPVDYTHYTGNTIAYAADVLDRVGVHGSINADKFKQEEVKICVNNDGVETFAGHRRMIRIVKNSHSQTGIELVDMDSDEEESCD